MKTLVTLTLLVSLSTSCSTTTEASRLQAKATADEVARYKRVWSERIDGLNKRYRETAAEILRELTDLEREDRGQEQARDQQIVADQILSAWKSETLPSRIWATFEKIRDEEFGRIESGERALAQARRSYAEAYREASLELDRLDRVISNLRKLGAEPDEQAAFMRFASLVVRVYDEIREERESAELPSDAPG